MRAWTVLPTYLGPRGFVVGMFNVGSTSTGQSLGQIANQTFAPLCIVFRVPGWLHVRPRVSLSDALATFNVGYVGPTSNMT